MGWRMLIHLRKKEYNLIHLFRVIRNRPSVHQRGEIPISDHNGV
jgi:hypothetical protein